MKINEDDVQALIVKKEREMGITESRQIFVSYHCQTTDHTINGFGNLITKFYPELYKDNLVKFIQDLEKSITMALETLHKGNKFEVKVLFYR